MKSSEKCQNPTSDLYLKGLGFFFWTGLILHHLTFALKVPVWTCRHDPDAPWWSDTSCSCLSDALTVRAQSPGIPSWNQIRKHDIGSRRRCIHLPPSARSSDYFLPVWNTSHVQLEKILNITDKSQNMPPPRTAHPGASAHTCLPGDRFKLC